jgi:hypothetical protein
MLELLEAAIRAIERDEQARRVAAEGNDRPRQPLVLLAG